MEPIQQYRPKPGAIQIRYSILYEQHAARQVAGLTLDEYNNLPGTPFWMDLGDVWSKSHVIAWYRYNNLIPVVQQDAAQRRSDMQRNMRG